MHRLHLIRCAAVLGVLASGCTSIDNRPIEERLAHQVVFTVSVDDGTQANAYSDSFKDVTKSRRTTSLVIQDILNLHGLKKIAQWPIKALGLHAVVAEFSRKRKRRALLSELETDVRVESVQSVKSYRLLAYNDPYFELQSAVNSDHIEQIHELATGKNVVVGVIDTGMDRSHPELDGSIIYSRNYVGHDQLRFDRDEHGTSVAGVIASAVNNEVGIVGVAPDVKLMAFKACWHDPRTRRASCDSFSLMKALVDVLKQQPDILNLSLSGPDDPLIRRLLRTASDQGIVLIGARDTTRETSFPSSMPEVIAVGTPLDSDTSPSGYGVLAPGTDILTTTPGATYAFRSGSSLASAYVSGVAALIMERQPTLSGKQIETHLRDTARDRVGAVPVVDICAAVRRGREVCPDTAIASRR